MKQLYNVQYVKSKLRDEFNIDSSNIKLMGSGYDSEAYLIDDTYIFKFTKHKFAVEDYLREKNILDFLNKELKSNVKVPNVEYFKKLNDVAIMGYKSISGTFLSPKVYKKMNDNQKNELVKSISKFLNELHNISTDKINEYRTNNKLNFIDDFEFIKSHVYNLIGKKEIELIESIFNQILHNPNIFNGKKCLIHNDLSCNHILLNDNYELLGIIDWGDACISDEHCDFMYLLEESDEEVGREFGLNILKQCGFKDIKVAIEYSDLIDKYYPIISMIYGIKYNNKELFSEGLDLLKAIID